MKSKDLKKDPGEGFLSYPDTSRNNTNPMTKDQTELFFVACMLDGGKDFPPSKNKDVPFIAQIINGRISHFNLPISFSEGGLMAAVALCDSPGKAVVFLCDCFHRYEGMRVTSKEISDLYPFGFYSMPVLEDIIDNYMKKRIHPWSRIY